MEKLSYKVTYQNGDVITYKVGELPFCNTLVYRYQKPTVKKNKFGLYLIEKIIGNSTEANEKIIKAKTLSSKQKAVYADYCNETIAVLNKAVDDLENIYNDDDYDCIKKIHKDIMKSVIEVKNKLHHDKKQIKSEMPFIV
jgi:hypothetical protein